MEICGLVLPVNAQDKALIEQLCQKGAQSCIHVQVFGGSKHSCSSLLDTVKGSAWPCTLE